MQYEGCKIVEIELCEYSSERGRRTCIYMHIYKTQWLKVIIAIKLSPGEVVRGNPFKNVFTGMSQGDLGNLA
jgi:hypothetical protein